MNVGHSSDINSSCNAKNTETIIDQLELLQAYRDTAIVLASAIASKDSFEQHHIQRVQVVCRFVGETMGLASKDLEGVLMGALFHDIGKLAVSDHVLLKPGTLTEQEFEQVRSHAALGASMLENVKYPWDICGMVRHHHECWDGSGYPDHISGEDIPLGARIISVAEVYDALISDRCYKGKWTHSQVVKAISADSGTRFDPTVADAFLKCEKEIKKSLSKLSRTEYTKTTSTETSIAVDAIGRANRELVSMFDIVQSINSSMQTNDILEILVDRILKTFSAANCTIYLIDEFRVNVLTAVESVGSCSDLLDGQEWNLFNTPSTSYTGPTNWSAMFTPDLAQELTYLKSCMTVPMVDGAHLIGVMAVYSEQENAYNAEDERVLSFVAQKAAYAIRGAMEYEQIKESATRDQLTGLYNAGFLIEHLDSEIKRASRRSEVVYVLGLDLDNFKQINDNLGHSVGDEVLCHAADILAENVREYDIVARMGGDEFAVVLPQTTLQGTLDVANRLRSLFIEYACTLPIPHPNQVDMSIGVASFPKDGLDAKTLLNAADIFMYAEKRSHKSNRAA